MTITFTYVTDGRDGAAVDQHGRSPAGPSCLAIDGAVNDMHGAAAIVRAHAIETGDIASIRLVRTLRDATTPDDILAAIAAFRKWTTRIVNARG